MNKQALIEELLEKGIYKQNGQQLWQLDIEELQKLLKEENELREE